MNQSDKPYKWTLVCMACDSVHGALPFYDRCECGGLLDVTHDWSERQIRREDFHAHEAPSYGAHRSGVWRYRELILPIPMDDVVSRGEGATNLYESPRVAKYCGLSQLLLKHEGENPTGSFKDRGMAVAITAARLVGAKAVACASTGNTSASLAAYAAVADLPAIVFVPKGGVTQEKMSQAVAYGARVVQVAGNFDDCMRLVEQVSLDCSVKLLNSLNPFRIEGQKTIAFELAEQLGWNVPDWVVLPGGNLGNSSAIAKAFVELYELKLIDRLPRLAIIQARGANPLAHAFATQEDVQPVDHPKTIATAISIGNPVSVPRCLRGLDRCGGIAIDVDDSEILEAKAMVDASGIGAEPASCATVAGARKLVADGVIAPSESVCGILTGNLLKDTQNALHAAKLRSGDNGTTEEGRVVKASLQEVRTAVQEALDH
ncbi:MAG: threonine synthase [Pirellulales bacterium]|nr:threonine synthase [Pirellulales bacterium]